MSLHLIVKPNVKVARYCSVNITLSVFYRRKTRQPPSCAVFMPVLHTLLHTTSDCSFKFLLLLFPILCLSDLNWYHNLIGWVADARPRSRGLYGQKSITGQRRADVLRVHPLRQPWREEENVCALLLSHDKVTIRSYQIEPQEDHFKTTYLYFRVKHLETDACSSCLSSWFPSREQCWKSGTVYFTVTSPKQLVGNQRMMSSVPDICK